jgi:transposase
MILLSDEGLSPPQIARRVWMSDRTVRRTIDRYEAEGLAGLHNKPIPGRPPRVTAPYLEQLEGSVERNPSDFPALYRAREHLRNCWDVCIETPRLPVWRPGQLADTLEHTGE